MFSSVINDLIHTSILHKLSNILFPKKKQEHPPPSPHTHTVIYYKKKTHVTNYPVFAIFSQSLKRSWVFFLTLQKFSNVYIHFKVIMMYF